VELTAVIADAATAAVSTTTFIGTRRHGGIGGKETTAAVKRFVGRMGLAMALSTFTLSCPCANAKAVALLAALPGAHQDHTDTHRLLVGYAIPPVQLRAFRASTRRWELLPVMPSPRGWPQTESAPLEEPGGLPPANVQVQRGGGGAPPRRGTMGQQQTQRPTLDRIHRYCTL